MDTARRLVERMFEQFTVDAEGELISDLMESNNSDDYNEAQIEANKVLLEVLEEGIADIKEWLHDRSQA